VAGALEFDHSPPARAKYKNERSYTSTPPICFLVMNGKDVAFPPLNKKIDGLQKSVRTRW
jgi:hypothetical protein